VLTVLAGSGTAHTSLLAEPGTVAFLVVFGMAVMLYFVFRSMSKHLRKVSQAARDEEEDVARTGAQDATGGSSDNAG
jgi:cobalamin biosynthesis protein CobD/CbiB